jgi:hypothetical protein
MLAMAWRNPGPFQEKEKAAGLFKGDHAAQKRFF